MNPRTNAMKQFLKVAVVAGGYIAAFLIGSEEEERCARGHESGHTEYGDEEKRVPERVHAA